MQRAVRLGFEDGGDDAHGLENAMIPRQVKAKISLVGAEPTGLTGFPVRRKSFALSVASAGDQYLGMLARNVEQP
jgi:hypothetical protein